MQKANHITYFNSNSDQANLLCFGDGEKLILNEEVDLNEIQHFLDKHKNRFIVSYFSYELKNNIEKLTSHNFDALNFPKVYMHVPKNVAQIKNGKISFIQGDETSKNQRFVNRFLEELTQKTKLKNIQFKARTSKESYLETVNQLKKHIQRGDIYEINYCQEYYSENIEIENPIQLYTQINAITEAPFSVFLQHDSQTVFCFSPERFIQKKGNQIISQPIKGTAPRGKNKQEDEQLKTELLTNQKELSENVMIVDLVRNDLSKIAQKGSVKVDELCGAYSFKTVHQLISTISCELDKSSDFLSILKATFPMGSMTGAPKVSAMQLSETYEDFQRGLYAGTIGYFLPNGNFDFNVVIRSLLHNRKNNYLSCAVGGAITIKSDAEKEYEECQTKIGKLIQAI